MKKIVSSLIVVAMLISSLAILSSCSGNSASNSDIENSDSIKSFSDNVAGVWMLLEDNNPYASVSFLTISENMTMTSGVYPGAHGRTCEITEIHSKNDGSLQAVLYYPATEATDMDDAMPEYKANVVFSSDDTFRNSFIIECDNGQRSEYEYISDDFDKATKEFDKIIDNKSSYSSNQNQNQNQSQQQPTHKTAVYTYTHSALEGAVIIKADSSTGAVKYKEKCEKCGKVGSSTVSIYIKSGTRDGSFYCSNCKSTQKVRIHCEMDVDLE